MEIDFSKLSLDQVTSLYQNAENQLKDALLNGSLWEEVKDKRMVVTKLAQQVWKKRQASGKSTPAESNTRE
ncbi:MAG TPA: hypothetical protein VGO09_05380 [Flavisolibacter sp.]|nr:hypothetical protein [Flavisolibacter sp.]